ncbi:MAG: UxaA family hydrolase, partial [Clostridia bacterium]|nr:UxaA family hydrolase [Clostridia bacterium]
LYNKKRSWIDFDAGQLLGGVSMDTLTEAFLDYILLLASGKAHAKSESLDRHDLSIFKDGVTL